MPTFLSYSAWIEVDEERLPEYCVTEEATPDGWSKVTCWIPSTAGKIFRIGYGENTRLRSTSVFFSVDGRRFPTSKVLRSLDFPQEAPLRKWYRKGVEAPRGLLPFAFGNCQLTDDESVPQSGEGVGEIQIDFYDTQIIGRRWEEVTVELDDEQSVALSRNRLMHEKTKKALVHRMELKEKPIEPAGRIISYVTTETGAKRVQFLFKYRPLDVLRAADIIPNPFAASAIAMASAQHVLAKEPPVIIDLTLLPSSPEITDAPREVIDLTLESDDDEDENQAFVTRLQEELVAVAVNGRIGQSKKKRSENSEDVPRRVKQESVENY